MLASELAAVGMNVNFAPVVDVNSNPLNPVINVRAYGDDPAMVGLLGRHMARGMAHAGVISAFKHFPGHGDAATDSHYGLPRVDKSRADAYATDLAPYRASIDLGEAPEMIMTAHIQYPSLDETRVATRTGESILVPATMSRKIQHDLLRGEFGYRGVTVSDALDMDAIANHFDPDQAVINLFRADVDIALMPVEFRTAGQADRLRCGDRPRRGRVGCRHAESRRAGCIGRAHHTDEAAPRDRTERIAPADICGNGDRQPRPSGGRAAHCAGIDHALAQSRRDAAAERAATADLHHDALGRAGPGDAPALR